RDQHLARPPGGDQVARTARQAGGREVPLEELVQLEETRESAPEVDVLHVEHHRWVLEGLTFLRGNARGASQLGIPARVDEVCGRERVHDLGGEATDQTHEVAVLLAVVEAAERADAAPGRHPAEKRELLDEHGAEARAGRGHRRRGPGRARPDDHDVGLARHRHALLGHDHGPLRHGSMIARAPRASRLTAPARRTKSDSVVEPYETLIHQIGPLLAVLLVAFVCGAALGLERELRRKAAGLKTIVLICVGSAIYAALARLMLADAGGQADPTRVAGQVITGVGFIGGGAILQAGGTIMGLTSAAVIWTAAG